MPETQAAHATIVDRAAVRNADAAALRALAEEVRTQLVWSVAQRGGHLGPNLGVVELTFALHRAFDSPRDAILWDTGHQSYVHKMVTGRSLQLPSLRSYGGLAGYPSRAESPHDWVENSHAGTSLSYAAGLADGRARGGREHGRVVAVIGDGALTAGMAMEALNDIADRGLDVVVVLNDNGRSYAPTTGAVARLLASLRAAPDAAPADLLGCRYLGPVDGHDLDRLDEALGRARALRGPTIVHVVTRKGKGYAPAEADEVEHLHGVGPFDPASGRQAASPPGRVPASSVVGDALLSFAHADPRVVVVTAAMGSATGLQRFAAELPDRLFDVGIAEQHAATFAAGLAMAGLRPIVAIHSTFLNRAFDQIVFDVGLHGLPVVFVADRAGITGGDGASHHGLLDVALFRHVPDALIAAPSNAGELVALLDCAMRQDGVVLVRHPKALDVGPAAPPRAVEPGRWSWDGTDGDVLVIGSGDVMPVAREAAERLRGHGLQVSCANALWLAPLDPRMVERAGRHRLVVTVEDHFASGGLGSAVLERLADEGVPIRLVRCGVPARYLPHGDVPALRELAALDAAAVEQRALALLEAPVAHG